VDLFCFPFYIISLKDARSFQTTIKLKAAALLINGRSIAADEQLCFSALGMQRLVKRGLAMSSSGRDGSIHDSRISGGRLACKSASSSCS
jgi:hypothetical protein